jgi:hypothetical protein
MATPPNPMMMAGGPPDAGGPPGPGGAGPNPLLLMLMQRLAQQSRGAGGPGGPPGMPGGGPPGAGPGLAAARGIAQTPFGQERQDLAQMKTQVGALVPHFLQRDPGIASKLVGMYKTIDQILDAIAKLPAAPVAAPPPGMPMMGGPAMTPPPDAGMMG